MRNLITLATLLLLAVVVGCGESLPTEETAKESIQKGISRDVPIKVVSVRKTNGLKSVVFGVEHYKMEYEAVIEFTEDCFWGKSMRATRDGDILNFMGPGLRWQAVKKGERAVEKGSVSFVKTENGWQ